MMHDLLLSCLSLKRLSINIQMLASNESRQFIHPCEQEAIQRITNFINFLHEVDQFTRLCREQANKDNAQDPTRVPGTELPYGYYIENFCRGLDEILEDYFSKIVKIESVCLASTNNSLIYIHNTLQSELPVIKFVRKLIRETQTQQLHGCALLRNLYLKYHQNYGRLERVITTIIRPIKQVFLSHLANWVVFGKIDDIYSEFFIKYIPLEENLNKSNAEARVPYSDDFLQTCIWQYEINMNQLPGFVSSIWAEKVLFIGQTVLVFKMDRNLSTHKDCLLPMSTQDTLHNDTGEIHNNIGELWEGRESQYFKMVEDLNNDEKINAYRFENVINEIRKFVSKRLSEIALNDVDLEKQMWLIRDFYLLGRGEVYLEFLRQLTAIVENGCTLNTYNYIRAFETSAHVMGVSEALENFTFSSLKNEIDPDDGFEFGILQNIHLKYHYKWPLNLLFSPKALEQYNKVLRFLLILKKVQYKHNLIWAEHTWKARTKGPIDIRILNIHNQLTSFLNNVQYYVLVDVLESQFSILMDVIKSKADLEEIQRAHKVFLANILSQCFLLSEDDEINLSFNQSICRSQNPILAIIFETFDICEKFHNLVYKDEASETTLTQTQVLEERFHILMKDLVKLLVDLKTSCLGPLSQLLLRLNFNHWFTVNK